MKALLPVYCRPLGYVILIVALFLPFILVMMGKVTDTNLLFYKECTKLLMIVGALMILFAFSKNESRETEQIRNLATRNAIFLTVLFVFGGKRRWWIKYLKDNSNLIKPFALTSVKKTIVTTTNA